MDGPYPLPSLVGTSLMDAPLPKLTHAHIIWRNNRAVIVQSSCVKDLLKVIIVISKLLMHHSKAKPKAPAYSWAPTSIHSACNCLGGGSNTYSPCYRPSALTNHPLRSKLNTTCFSLFTYQYITLQPIFPLICKDFFCATSSPNSSEFGMMCMKHMKKALL